MSYCTILCCSAHVANKLYHCCQKTVMHFDKGIEVAYNISLPYRHSATAIYEFQQHNCFSLCKSYSKLRQIGQLYRSTTSTEMRCFIMAPLSRYDLIYCLGGDVQCTSHCTNHT